jgi:hypothetical protein
MKCEVCKSETNPGDFYVVRYGSERSEVLSSRKTAVYRSIAGSEQVFICNSCLERHISRRALLAGGGFALLAASVGLVGILTGKPVNEQISPIVLGLIGGIMLYFLVSKKQKEGKGRLQMGDLYAIRLARPRLKAQGYRSFYTRQD